MAKLTDIPAGSAVYVDANIFIYHFTGVSHEATAFLERCEVGDLAGYTGSLVLLEVMHRLMIIEARMKGLSLGSSPARQLADHPDVVKSLHEYNYHVSRIPEMGVTVLDLPPQFASRSFEFRHRYGLLTNDSIIALEMADVGLSWLASSDRAFDRVPQISRAAPSDLPADFRS